MKYKLMINLIIFLTLFGSVDIVYAQSVKERLKRARMQESNEKLQDEYAKLKISDEQEIENDLLKDIWTDIIELDPNAAYFQFNYRFIEPGARDFVEVFINGKLSQKIIAAKYYSPYFQDSDFIDISRYANRSLTYEIRFVRFGDSQKARLEVKHLSIEKFQGADGSIEMIRQANELTGREKIEFLFENAERLAEDGKNWDATDLLGHILVISDLPSDKLLVHKIQRENVKLFYGEDYAPYDESQFDEGDIDDKVIQESEIQLNDRFARSRLRELINAAKAYAVAHGGVYPGQISLLTDAKPPYITTNYCDQALTGYQYNCAMTVRSCEFTATPEIEGETGSRVFRVYSE